MYPLSSIPPDLGLHPALQSVIPLPPTPLHSLGLHRIRYRSRPIILRPLLPFPRIDRRSRGILHRTALQRHLRESVQRRRRHRGRVRRGRRLVVRGAIDEHVREVQGPRGEVRRAAEVDLGDDGGEREADGEAHAAELGDGHVRESRLPADHVARIEMTLGSDRREIDAVNGRTLYHEDSDSKGLDPQT